MKIGSVLVLALLGATAALADNFSFQGTFTKDDNVQLFTFNVGSTSTVTLRTWSYAGGVDAAGVTIPRGGFDPILALFDSTGAYINQNDDGTSAEVPAEALPASTTTRTCNPPSHPGSTRSRSWNTTTPPTARIFLMASFAPGRATSPRHSDVRKASSAMSPAFQRGIPERVSGSSTFSA